jgi:hypothetical protein
MALRKAHPVRFTPKGLTDAFDATDMFQGACTALTNLVFDQVNPEFVVDIPGTLVLADFTGVFTTPGFVSIQVPIGTRVYGMLATGRNAGHDEPFVYESATNTFITVSNVLAGNTPSSPLTTGDWVPPTLTVVGTMVIITHPGFSGAGANFYGVIDITNPAAPAWRSENTTTHLLPSVPTSVVNFNNRAFFACGNALNFTDPLTNPLTITNANQVLTLGDTLPIIAQSGLPNQTTGSGIVQSLTAFKQTQIWQITGDYALANLSVNFLSLTVGTQFPRSLQQCPAGLYFVSSGGPYFIDLLGGVRELVASPGESRQPDIQVPFQNAVTPTRWASAYSSSIYRVCGPTVVQGVQSVNDYWFDEHKRRWTGPHSFAYDCGGAINDIWCLSSAVNPAKLIQGTPVPNSGFPVTNLGLPIAFNLQSSTFPKEGDMFVKQVTQSQIELSSPQSPTTFQISALNERGNVIGGPISITFGTPPPLWGQVGLTWGMGGLFWTSSFAALRPNTQPVYWTAPLIFEKMALSVSGTLSGHVGLGTFQARYQKTGYATTGNQ